MITFDTNVLVYAVDAETPDKHERARGLLRSARDADLVLTAQTLGEFLNVFRTRKRSLYSAAVLQAERFATLFPVLNTTAEHVLTASTFAEKYKLQLWDCVIWQIARSAGASFFISEDLQDGLTLEGMTVINPFEPSNDAALRSLLRPAAESN